MNDVEQYGICRKSCVVQLFLPYSTAYWPRHEVRCPSNTTVYLMEEYRHGNRFMNLPNVNSSSRHNEILWDIRGNWINEIYWSAVVIFVGENRTSWMHWSDKLSVLVFKWGSVCQLWWVVASFSHCGIWSPFTEGSSLLPDRGLINVSSYRSRVVWVVFVEKYVFSFISWYNLINYIGNVVMQTKHQIKWPSVTSRNELTVRDRQSSSAS